MDLPADNIILFDGVCHLCNGFVQFIIRRDRRGIFKFAPLQSALGREISRAYGLDPDPLQSVMLVSKNGAFLRSDAALEVATQLGGLWRLVGVFKIVPKGLRDWVYCFIARNRYLWFGKREACMIPTPEVRQRFLT